MEEVGRRLQGSGYRTASAAKFQCGSDLEEPKKRKRIEHGHNRASPSARRVKREGEIEVIDLDDTDDSTADSVPNGPATPVRMATTRKCHDAKSLQVLIRTDLAISPIQLKENLELFLNPGMASRISGSAIEYMCLETIQGWEVPTNEMVAKLTTAIENHLVKLAKHQELAGKWSGCMLERSMVNLIREFVQGRKAQQLKLALDASEREKIPVILNTQEHEKTAKEEYERLEKLRFKLRATALHMKDISVHQGNESRYKAAKDSADELISKKEDQFRQRLGPDHFMKEVKAMAEMKAFYAYSARRYVEVVIQLVRIGYALLRPNLLGLKAENERAVRLR